MVLMTMTLGTTTMRAGRKVAKMSNWDNTKSLTENAMAGRDITEPEQPCEGGVDKQELLKNLENLYRRLQADYNGDSTFQQHEEDRLALYYAIDMVRICEEDLFINVDDNPGTHWALGKTDSIQGWRETAQFWADNDGMEETVQNLAEMPDEDVIDYISDVWDIHIVPYDKTDPEHTALRNEYERI